MDGSLTAAAVVATSYANTRSVVFHHGGTPPAADPARAIDYAATPLLPEHVLASAAIPGAFPAVEIHRPRELAGWYGDGGVRLNAPLEPALALGAEGVVVIGLNSSVTPAGPRAAARRASTGSPSWLRSRSPTSWPTTWTRSPPSTRASQREPPPPKALPAGGSPTSSSPQKTAWRSAASPAACTAPLRRCSTACCAEAAWRVLGRFLNARRGPVHGELLSYLFLAREFIDELIGLGRRDGERWLQTSHDNGLWQVGRL